MPVTVSGDLCLIITRTSFYSAKFGGVHRQGKIVTVVYELLCALRYGNNGCFWREQERALVQASCRSVAQPCPTLRPHGLQHARPPCPSPTPGACSDSCPLSQRCHPPSHPRLSPSPPALSLSQHQGLFQPVDSLHQVAKVSELQLQLQRQSFQ